MILHSQILTCVFFFIYYKSAIKEINNIYLLVFHYNWSVDGASLGVDKLYNGTVSYFCNDSNYHGFFLSHYKKFTEITCMSSITCNTQKLCLV